MDVSDVVQQAPVPTPTRIRPAPRQDEVETRDLPPVQQAPVPTPTRIRPAPRQNGVENRDPPRGHVAPVRRGRTLTIRRETIAEQMEDIKLRIQGKLPDPPKGQVKSVQDWPLTLRWMEDMVNYVRNVHPLLALFVQTKKNGDFSVAEEDISGHPYSLHFDSSHSRF